jgi:hypothetical protein
MIEKELSGAAAKAILEQAGEIIRCTDSPEMRIQIADEAAEAVKIVLRVLHSPPQPEAFPIPD